MNLMYLLKLMYQMMMMNPMFPQMNSNQKYLKMRLFLVNLMNLKYLMN